MDDCILEDATTGGKIQVLEVLLVRHGETTWNVERRLQGSVDPGPGLTDRGIHQSRCVGRLHLHGVDCVFTSPLRRCKETLEYILQECHDHVVVKEDGGLKERDLGEFAGCMIDREILQRIKKNEGVESYDELIQRSKRTMLGIVQDALNKGYQTIMVLSHGGFISSVARFVAPNTKHSSVQNGSVSCLQAHDNNNGRGGGIRWKIETWNDVSHLTHDEEYREDGHFGGETFG